jgi:hypothetical protein
MSRIYPLLTLSIAIAIAFSTAADSCRGQEKQTTEKQTDKEITIKIDVEVKDDEDEKDDGEAKEGDRIPVDVAILLDTSNSMDGLISQARSQLWTIVQRLSVAEKEGRKPALRVSIFEYGNTNLPATENYIRQVLPLCDDLDKVSEKLFALSTRGGDEYCGAVIGEAVDRLDWSSDPDAYRSIFIAGNESFTQGAVHYAESCAKAKSKNIIVNTIHCGDHSTGVAGKWADGAIEGGGESFNINQDRQQVRIKCPQDKLIIELNAKLNKTYLWYGKKATREYSMNNQLVQDSNFGIGGGGALGMGGAAPSAGFSSRVASKASSIYDNRGRDLVDASKASEDALAKVKDDELPEEMQKMTAEQRKAHVAKMAAERAAIQKEILELSKAREKHIAAKRKELSKVKGGTFGDAIVTAIDSQLESKGFSKNNP